MKKKDLKKIVKIASSDELETLKFIEYKCDAKFKGKSHSDLKHFIKEWYPIAVQIKGAYKTISSSRAQVAKAIGSSRSQIAKTYYEQITNQNNNNEYGDFDGNDDFDYEYLYE